MMYNDVNLKINNTCIQLSSKNADTVANLNLQKIR